MIADLAGVVWKKIPWSWRRSVVRLTQDRFTVSAAALITNHEGKVLLLDHRVRPGSGWGLPGGFLEHGEQPEQGVRREIREETGLELENVTLVRARTSFTHIEIVFRAYSDGTPEIKSREIKDFGWFDVDELPPGMDRSHKSLIDSALEG